MFVQSSCRRKKKKIVWREREHTQNGEDRITFVCFSFISSVFSLQLVCVFSPVQAKSKTEQCQCAFKYHSIEHEREHYNYACVSVGLCPWIHIILCAYVCSCMCMCSPRGAYLCHCQYVQAGSWGQLCVEGPGCSPHFSWKLQWSMSNAGNSKNKPPTSYWPYPEDISLHLGQQQHE